MEHKVVIAADFSEFPGARNYGDGEKTGEEFYDLVLKTAFKSALDDNKKLFVDIDGTNGYATSFLDQAFGELAKEYGVEVVLANIEIKSEDEPDLLEDIMGYIKDAHKA